MIQTVLQRKVQGLADAGRFHSFHVLLSNPKEVLCLQIIALQRPVFIIRNEKNKCKGDSTQKEPLHLLVKITMRLQSRMLSSRLPASCCDSPKVTASSSRRTRSTIW